MVVLDRGGSRNDERFSDSVCMLKVGRTGFGDELAVESRHIQGF